MKALLELRTLRTQEKAIKARIDEISPKAADEAVAILAEKGQDLSSISLTTTSTKVRKLSATAKKPRRKSKRRVSSKRAPPQWQATSRPTSNSTPTKNLTRSNSPSK